ncbi:MAG TPA: universal stress protein, partial [Cupriavidus sp.]|nr:universal stress protein [Cupriavidus sp.]
LARDCPVPVVLVRDDSPARTAERPVAQK